MVRSYALLVGALSIAIVDARQLKVRVVSDIHAGSCWQTNQSILFDFLRQTAKDDVDVLVLNGDIYDFWLLPLNRTQPSVQDAMNNGIDPSLGFDMATFQRLLRGAAKGVVELHEENGNHDLWLTEKDAQKVFQGEKLSWTADSTLEWGVRFEHGHQYSMFEQVPPGSDLMPMGYVVSRVVASYACSDSASRVSHFTLKAISDLLGSKTITEVGIKMLAKKGLFKLGLHHMLSSASTSKIGHMADVPVVGVRASNTLPVAGDNHSNYTLHSFIEDYADALDRFIDAVGVAGAARMLSADIIPGQLDQDAGKSSVNESLVVVGHTHVPTLQLVRRDVPHFSRTPDVLVVNAGAWVNDDDGKAWSSYVDLTIDDIVEDFSECYSETDGKDYRGTVSVSEKGESCLSWGNHTVKGGRYNSSFGDVAFCRNLGDKDAPWCFTGANTWAKCSVGRPSSSCKKETVRGATAVKIYSFPDTTPLAEASREASTGAHWKLSRTLNPGSLGASAPVDLMEIVV